MTGKALGACVFVLTTALARPGAAGQAGQAKGNVTLDEKATSLAYATSTTAENLFDSSKRDTIVVLSDRPLEGVSPDDEVELNLQARDGKLIALALRLDGSKLVNVSVHSASIAGVQILPGAWFTHRTTGAGTGALTLPSRSYDGHTYACAVEYTAAAAAKPRAAAEAIPAAQQAPPPTPTLPPASTSTVDPKAMAAMLIGAMMNKDEEQALKLVQSGADPNLRDQTGIPMLNWAVMVCMPRVVKVLVDRGADLKVERAPGLTIMQEAGACPEAAKILRAAGAK